MSRIVKWVFGSVLSFVFLAVGLFAGARWGVPRYLSSPDFRKRIGERTAGLIDTPGGFKPLRWQSSTVTTDGFLARGNSGRALQELEAQGLTAQCEWTSLWQRRAVVKQLTIENLQAAFSPETVKNLAQPQGGSPELEQPLKKDSSIQVDLHKVVVHRATLFWGQSGDDYGAFREVGVCLWPDGKNFAAYGDGGTFQIGELPQAAVRPFQVRYVKPNLDVEWGSLTLGGLSEVKVMGQFQFTQPSRMDLKLGFRRCPAAPFLSPEIKSKFDGTFESDTRVHQVQNQPARFEGAAHFTDAMLRNVDGLAKLAAFTKEPRFKALQFQKLHGNFAYSGSELTVNKLMVEAHGLFQMEGNITVNEKKLRGTMELGVSAKLLGSFPGAKEEVFTKFRDDYYWTTVRLSGTTDQPAQDLKDRILAAAKKHPIEALAPPLTNAIDKLAKPVKSLVEKLKELF